MNVLISLVILSELLHFITFFPSIDFSGLALEVSKIFTELC